ncbi:hypothetical protein D3C86_1385430 [compost metagenome]
MCAACRSGRQPGAAVACPTPRRQPRGRVSSGLGAGAGADDRTRRCRVRDIAVWAHARRGRGRPRGRHVHQHVAHPGTVAPQGTGRGTETDPVRVDGSVGARTRAAAARTALQWSACRYALVLDPAQLSLQRGCRWWNGAVGGRSHHRRARTHQLSAHAVDRRPGRGLPDRRAGRGGHRSPSDRRVRAVHPGPTHRHIK